MSHILYTVSLIAISSGILELFSCSGRLKKYTSFAVSVVIVLSLLSPLIDTLSLLPSALENNGKIFEDIDSETDANRRLAETLKKIINEDISVKMKIPKDVFYTEIMISTQNGEKIISKVTLYITDNRYFRYCERIEAYLKSHYGCETQVIQFFKE